MNKKVSQKFFSVVYILSCTYILSLITFEEFYRFHHQNNIMQAMRFSLQQRFKSWSSR